MPLRFIEDPRLTAAVMGSSAPMQALRRHIASAARREEAVVLVGEPGLGADLIAQLIHTSGPRRDRRLVTFRCSGLPGPLVLSELFGHLKGSFPGAYRDKPGLVWKAQASSVLLDDLSQTSPAVQDAVGRFIQTGHVQPIGATTPLGSVRVRVMAATTCDRQSAASGGPLSDVLAERFPIQLRIPPLRERGRDVLLLLQRLLQEASAAHGTDCPTLSLEAEEQVLAYRWPENVRELQAVARQLTVPGRRMITVRHVTAHLRTA